MAYIGLDRGIVDHWIYQDPEYFKVWFEMLYRARYLHGTHPELVEGEIVYVEYGEFIFGRIKWSERLKVSEQRIRTLLKKLKSEQMIEVVSEHRKCTVYRIKNYAKFNQQSNQQNIQQQQGFEGDANQQINRQLTSSQPAANQQLTTKEESNKEIKKQSIKKDIVYSPEFESFFDSYPRQIGKPAAFNNFKKLLKKGIAADYLMACAMNYQSYCIANETETQYIKMPNNFLNPKDEYFKQFESPVLIHSRGRNGQASQYQRTKGKLDQMLMEEVEKQNDQSGHYYAY